jgi:hypothetical protein
MEEKNLQQKLSELHAEIEGAQDIDEESLQMLAHLQHDIQNLLGSSADLDANHSLTERLTEAIARFEATHPDLTRNMGQVLDLLSQLGI